MSELSENQKAKVSFKTEDGVEKTLECTIKEIYTDRVSLDCNQNVLLYPQYLQEGEEVKIQVYASSGVKAFDAIIINSPLDGDFVVEYIGDYVQIQRREYARAPLETKVIIERDGEKNVVTHTLDIGGGGVRFYHEGKFHNQENVVCRLYLPMILASIQAKSTIIDPPHLQTNQHVLLFTSIKETDRDKILKKCFEIETANRTFPDKE